MAVRDAQSAVLSDALTDAKESEKGPAAHPLGRHSSAAHLLGGLFLLRLTGPGKVWLQSMSLPMLAHALEPYLPQANGNTQSGSAQGALNGGLAAAAQGISKLL